jgi:threonine synthase
MGQLVYYFWSYFKVENNLRRVSYVVPTGNFGNVYAGYISKKMGLPINKLVVSSNKNDILTRFFETGVMKLKQTIKTVSPSMDIQVSSNFERLLYDYSKSTKLIKNLYRDLNMKGYFSVDTKLLDLMRNSFRYGRLNDKETLSSINKIFKRFRIIIDPHTAVGYSIGKTVLDDSEKRIYLATAHYSKFIDTVKKVINDQVTLPKRISSIINKEEKFDLLENNLKELIQYITEKSCVSRQV